MIVFALYFIFSLLLRMYEHRADHWYLFSGVSVILVLCTCIKITHQFSALYTFQVMPLLLLMLIPYDKVDGWKLGRTILLLAGGFVNYFFYA
jgi:hypothetical protein